MLKTVFFLILHCVAIFSVDVWWVFWSNFRWRKARRDNVGIEEDEAVHSLQEIRDTADKIRKIFKYTPDGINELFDCIVPPSELYLRYKEGRVEDDCDGFHCLMYHFVVNSGYMAFLLTANAYKSGHCVLLFKVRSRWYVCDYSYIHEGADQNGFGTAQEAITDYNKYYCEHYHTPSRVFYNGVLYYDYNNKKFRTVRGSKVLNRFIKYK